MKIIDFLIERHLKKNSIRFNKILKNVIISLGVKGGSILVSFLLVPIIINYINPTEYGVWLTLSSIVGWLAFFDIGLGNGLKNKVAESLANNDIESAKKYVSTTYVLLTIISVILFILFKVLNYFINWYSILNISENEISNLSLVVDVILASICIQFVVKLINVIFTAKQEPARADFLIFLGQLMVLVVIFIMKRNTIGELYKVVWVLALVPILVLIFSSFYYYSKNLKSISPSFKFVDFSYSKSLLKIGATFFFIQFGVLIVFQTDNIIISRILGAAKVTEFNVTYKLFSVVYLAFSILAAPYWVAFTDANAKKDFEWMKTNIKILRKIWLFLSFIVLPVLLLFSNFLFKIWLGKGFKINFELSIVMCIYIILLSCLLLGMNLINGVGKIRLQFYLYMVAAVFNIPLGIYLGKKLGLVGVTLSNILIFVFMNIFIWIQTNKIINQKDEGIWSK